MGVIRQGTAATENKTTSSLDRRDGLSGTKKGQTTNERVKEAQDSSKSGIKAVICSATPRQNVKQSQANRTPLLATCV